ncbi:uncharacterized protein LOC123322032 isoform X3 [Coccinella septempunctata]|uniref:uncharacterized protein LOC123322032 isoform X3 n=1 Tax=Coccinella septempunctata TaxID=41139 RepID=UPI001D0880D8|nr:uncharacterized protein LOC123322032 isoform X3 [Coccinella septempunctata]
MCERNLSGVLYLSTYLSLIESFLLFHFFFRSYYCSIHDRLLSLHIIMMRYTNNSVRLSITEALQNSSGPGDGSLGDAHLPRTMKRRQRWKEGKGLRLRPRKEPQLLPKIQVGGGRRWWRRLGRPLRGYRRHLEQRFSGRKRWWWRRRKSEWRRWAPLDRRQREDHSRLLRIMEAVVAVSSYQQRGMVQRGGWRRRGRGYGRGRGRGSYRSYSWRRGWREARAVEAGHSTVEAPARPSVEWVPEAPRAEVLRQEEVVEEEENGGCGPVWKQGKRKIIAVFRE